MDICSKGRPRDRIVDTAQDLFREHGIKGVGVDAIAEAAGTNKMTLYRHFASKDVLFHAVVDRVMRDLGVAIDRAMEIGRASCRERVSTLV